MNDTFCSLGGRFVSAQAFAGACKKILIRSAKSRILGVCRARHGRNC